MPRPRRNFNDETMQEAVQASMKAELRLRLVGLQRLPNDSRIPILQQILDYLNQIIAIGSQLYNEHQRITIWDRICQMNAVVATLETDFS